MPPQRCGLIPRRTLLRERVGRKLPLAEYFTIGQVRSRTDTPRRKFGEARLQAGACCVTLAAEGNPPSSLLLHHCCTDAALIYAIRRAKTRVLVRRLLRRKKIALGLCMHKHAEILARHGCHYHSAKVSSPSFSLSSSSFHIQFHTTV